MRRAFALFLVFMLLAASASATVLPPEGISAGYLSFTGIEAYRAVVLCESLSVCDERDGNVIDWHMLLVMLASAAALALIAAPSALLLSFK